MKHKKMRMVPAIPPEDYDGGIGKWMVSLETRGLWDGVNPVWYGNVMIPSAVWWEILVECEG